MTRIRIATRSSPLALWQAEYVARLIHEATGTSTELVHVSTYGDRDRSESIASFGGIGVFTREVQRAVLDAQADVAVHSLKDLPTEATEGLLLAAVPARAPRFDALVLPAGVNLPPDPAVILAAIPEGARIGTGSPRRRSQLLRLRPDLLLEDVRGNVETRLKKLDEGEYDAIVLAEAGLLRLGLGDRISLQMRPPSFFPAAGQGALGIECRSDDDAVANRLAALDDFIARCEITAERSALASLRAGCHAPVGTLAELDGSRMSLSLVVLSLDGRERYAASVDGTTEDPAALGRAAAEQVLRDGARHLLL